MFIIRRNPRPYPKSSSIQIGPSVKNLNPYHLPPSSSTPVQIAPCPPSVYPKHKTNEYVKKRGMNPTRGTSLQSHKQNSIKPRKIVTEQSRRDETLSASRLTDPAGFIRASPWRPNRKKKRGDEWHATPSWALQYHVCISREPRQAKLYSIARSSRCVCRGSSNVVGAQASRYQRR